MDGSRDGAAAFYRRYLTRCNEHRFDTLGEFVAADVNGPTEGLDRYIAGLHAVTGAFPDYHWDLHRLLVDDRWLAARLTGTGTHTGTSRHPRHRPAHPHPGTGHLPPGRGQDRRSLG